MGALQQLLNAFSTCMKYVFAFLSPNRFCYDVPIPIWNFENTYGQMFYCDMPTDSGYQISSKVVVDNYKAIW